MNDVGVFKQVICYVGALKQVNLLLLKVGFMRVNLLLLKRGETLEK